MSSTSLELSRQYASIGGTSITCVIDGEIMASLQGLSYVIQREKGPVYTMGQASPRSFSRGKRGIAGTMVTMMFDQHFVLSSPIMNQKFIANKSEIMPNVADINDISSLADLGSIDPSFTGTGVTTLSDSYVLSAAWYVDQIPPFDIVVVGATEYGASASMRIYGVEIMNEGSGFSVDNMTIENQMSYVAREIMPWTRLGSWDMSTGAFSPA